MTGLDCGAWLLSPRARRTDRHLLAGVCTRAGAPFPLCRVVASSRESGEPLAVTRSRHDGSWRLAGLPEYPERSLHVTAYDDADGGTYNSQTADYVSQVAEEPTP